MTDPKAFFFVVILLNPFFCNKLFILFSVKKEFDDLGKYKYAEKLCENINPIKGAKIKNPSLKINDLILL